MGRTSGPTPTSAGRLSTLPDTRPNSRGLLGRPSSRPGNTTQ